MWRPIEDRRQGLGETRADQGRVAHKAGCVYSAVRNKAANDDVILETI